MISALVRRGVAVTSTLALFETFASRAQLDPRTLHVLAPAALDIYRAEQAKIGDDNRGAQSWNRLLRKEMEFERAFLDAGGRLVAGNDPTGWGGIVAGFGNQREVELLVDAGLAPEAAIRVATANGAALLNDSTSVTWLPACRPISSSFAAIRQQTSRIFDRSTSCSGTASRIDPTRSSPRLTAQSANATTRACSAGVWADHRRPAALLVVRRIMRRYQRLNVTGRWCASATRAR